MRIIVTGSNGQLGFDVAKRCEELGLEVIWHNRKEADITNEVKIKEYIRNINPDAIIHCAAYTAVDKAEDEKGSCYNCNVNGTRFIAEVCEEIDAKLLYISTDYVFDGAGERPWQIDDIPNPINYYGYSKYLGELEIQKSIRSFFIVRVSWVFGKNGNNFIKTMLRLANNNILNRLDNQIKVVNDQVGSPTYTYDIAKLVCEMIQTDKFGIYHATNEGYCSWFEFACEIFKILNINVEVTPISSSQFITRAIRPSNSRLDKSSLSDNGFERLRNWNIAVSDYLLFLTEG